MATFGENIQTVADKLNIVADKLTAINTSLETIAGAIADGKLIVDPALTEAIKDLQFNSEMLDLGEIRLVFNGKALTIEGV
jgi:uncharacterized phage infection (PIP) family protein YhgE